MPGYVFMHADITDPDGYEKFKSLASAAIAQHDGRYLVRGGAMQPLEGQWRSRVVLLEFPTYAAALAFYKRHEYSVVKTIPRYYSNGVDAFVLEKELVQISGIERLNT